MTSRFLTKATIVTAVMFGFVAHSAFAWGPVAQRSIAATAFQVLGQLYRDPFKNADVNYESDVLKGVIADPGELGSSLSSTSRAEAVNNVGSEIQLLRDARKYGAGSYFAYRMGILAGLVSDIMLPFSFENDPQGKALLAKIDADIDAHVKDYHMSARPEHLEYIRSPVTYFKERQGFFADSKTIIAADYAGGTGYQGFLLKGGQDFFQKAVLAVADAWYTVLRTEGDTSDITPSPQALTGYLVNEIAYLLKVKKNMNEAENVYQQLTALTPNDQAVYEKVGDAFYAFGTKAAQERGVKEWAKALAMSGKNRQAISLKLSQHYLKQGKDLYDQASSPDAAPETLQLALESFTKALEYNRSSDEAANLINTTQVAIKERNQRLQLAVQMVSKGESVLKEADGNAVADQNEEALAKYDQAILVFQQVGPEFKEQKQAASDGIETAKRQIGRIIRKVLDQAQAQIDSGDRQVEDKKFDEAINLYNSVAAILKVVPDKESADAEQKKKLIDEAQSKAADAQRAKVQYEELQRTQAQQPGGTAGTTGTTR